MWLDHDHQPTFIQICNRIQAQSQTQNRFSRRHRSPIVPPRCRPAYLNIIVVVVAVVLLHPFSFCCSVVFSSSHRTDHPAQSDQRSRSHNRADAGDKINKAWKTGWVCEYASTMPVAQGICFYPHHAPPCTVFMVLYELRRVLMSSDSEPASPRFLLYTCNSFLPTRIRIILSPIPARFDSASSTVPE